MARPRTRTAVLDEGELEVMWSVFSTCPFAYQQMRLGEGMTYPAFQRAWQGKEVTPRDRDLIREGWREWSFRMIQVLREDQKRPVAEMYTPEGSPAAA